MVGTFYQRAAFLQPLALASAQRRPSKTTILKITKIKAQYCGFTGGPDAGQPHQISTHRLDGGGLRSPVEEYRVGTIRVRQDLPSAKATRIL